MVLGCLHERGRVLSSISAETSHQRRVIRFAVPHLKIVRRGIDFTAYNVHADKSYVDIGSYWCNYEVGTVSAGRIWTREQW